jgi:hypothetical protein
MSEIFKGRFTAKTEQPFVVFLIGMRINKLWAVHKWVPTAMAMGPMLKMLYEHPELGFLGGQSILSWRGVGLLTYWRSFEDLHHFAHAKDAPHVESWRKFSRSVGADGSVGIWHETYQINPGQFETVYGNMPKFGLGAVVEHVPATGNRQSAKLRMRPTEEASVPAD